MEPVSKIRTGVWSAVFLGLSGSISTAADNSLEVLNAVRRANAAALSSFTLSVTVEREVSWVFPDQGRYTEECTLTRNGENAAIACHTTHLPNPVYREAGTANYALRNYDSEEQLYIAMPAMHVALWTDERNETYQEHKSFSIDREGVVMLRGQVRALNRYHADDQNAWSRGELRKTWWALGQGLASGFQAVEGQTSDAGGPRRLHVRGTSNHGPLEGQWNVSLDPSVEQLIRSASFQLDTLETAPGLEIETKGLRWFGGVALPEEGIVRTKLGASGAWLEKKVLLRYFSHGPDEHVFGRVRETLDNAIAAGELTVYDYRENRTRPTITRH